MDAGNISDSHSKLFHNTIIFAGSECCPVVTFKKQLVDDNPCRELDIRHRTLNTEHSHINTEPHTVATTFYKIESAVLGR